MKFFRPKRTFHSVVRELVDGLEQGTVVLRHDEVSKELALADTLGRRAIARLRMLYRLVLAGFVLSLILAVLNGVANWYWWRAPSAPAVLGTMAGLLSIAAGCGVCLACCLAWQMHLARRQFEEAKEALKRGEEALAAKRAQAEWVGVLQKGLPPHKLELPGEPPSEGAEPASEEAIVEHVVTLLIPLGGLPEPLKHRVLGKLSRRVQEMAEAAPEG